jgi:hypothetical protein
MLVLASCSPAARDPRWADVSEHTPAALRDVDAHDPSLAANDQGRVALTWVTSDIAGANVWLAVSRDSGAHFAAPVRVNAAPGEVSSYAESRPVVAFGAGERVLVAWAARRVHAAGGLSRDADDIVVRMSDDGGAHFEPPVALNSDAQDSLSTYHGFLALATGAAGEVAAAWIDGRSTVLAPGEDEPARSEVRLAVSRDGGATWARDTLVARDVCSCCRLALHFGSAGHVAVAYRGAKDDLRDPRLAQSFDDGLTFARDTLVSADHWRLNGCPSIGPALAATSEGGLYAWYTGSDSTADGAPPGVYVKTWHVSGRTGLRRAMADSLRSANRPMLAAMGEGAMLGVLAVPREDSTRHVLAVRALDNSARPGAWLFLGAGVRTAVLASAGHRHTWAAWVEKLAMGPRVRLVRITPLP